MKRDESWNEVPIPMNPTIGLQAFHYDLFTLVDTNVQRLFDNMHKRSHCLRIDQKAVPGIGLEREPVARHSSLTRHIIRQKLYRSPRDNLKGEKALLFHALWQNKTVLLRDRKRHTARAPTPLWWQNSELQVPPPPCEQTNWKHNLCRTTVRRAVIIPLLWSNLFHSFHTNVVLVVIRAVHHPSRFHVFPRQTLRVPDPPFVLQDWIQFPTPINLCLLPISQY